MPLFWRRYLFNYLIHLLSCIIKIGTVWRIHWCDIYVKNTVDCFCRYLPTCSSERNEPSFSHYFLNRWSLCNFGDRIYLIMTMTDAVFPHHYIKKVWGKRMDCQKSPPQQSSTPSPISNQNSSTSSPTITRSLAWFGHIVMPFL